MNIRNTYNWMDLIGDIAGIFELIKAFFGILIFRISKISFYMSAMKKLFLVKFKKDTFDEKMHNEGCTLDDKLNVELKGVSKWMSTRITENIRNKALT